MPKDEKLTRDDFTLYLEGLSKKEIGDEFEIVIPPEAKFEDLVDMVWLTYQAEREQLIGGEGEAETVEEAEPEQPQDEIEVPSSVDKSKPLLFGPEVLVALPKLLEEEGKPVRSSRLHRLFIERKICAPSARRRAVFASFKANEHIVERRRSSYKTEGDVAGKGRGEYVYSLRN